MGNEIKRKQQQSWNRNEIIYGNVLNNYRVCQNSRWGAVRNVLNGVRLTLFEKMHDNNPCDSSQSIDPKLILLSHQHLPKPIPSPQIQHFTPIITYYLKRQSLPSSSSSSSSNTINLLSFSIKNQTTNQIIYPQSQTSNKHQSKKSNLVSMSTCGLKQIFRQDGGETPVSYSDSSRRGVYTISFLFEFFSQSLQNEITYRSLNNSHFRQKQIWSIIYCCCKQAQRLTSNNLKQPILSPSAIFITDNGQIKVGEWEFVSYYLSMEESRRNSMFVDEGEAIVGGEMMEMTIMKRSSEERERDVLMRYYWPPEGLGEIQNVLRVGGVERSHQKLSEAKNAQVFCLAMTILQMLTLKPYYKKTTYSEKQLVKLIQQAVDIRQALGQPISQEIVDLLLEMLQWDPKERFTFEQVIEYVHQVFESNEEIFRDSVNYERQSERFNKNDDESYFVTDRRQNGSLATDFSMDPPMVARHQYEASNMIKSVNFTVSLKANSLTTQTDNQYNKTRQYDSKKDCLLDSGVISQGLGDDYNPDHSDDEQQVQQLRDNKNSKPSALAYLSPIAVDPSDTLQPITDHQTLQLSNQYQSPDMDVDYQQQLDTTNQEHYQNQLQEFKQLNNNHSAQKPFILIENSSTEEFTINQYVPPGDWRSWKEQNKQISSGGRGFNETLDLMRSHDLKIMNRNGTNDRMKASVQFQSTPEVAIKPLELQNFSSILKQVASPFPSPRVQNKQYSILKPYEQQRENDKIFTSPNIMEMIREFTKKQSQQTPDFQNIQLPSTKQSYFETDLHLPKKLQFESKSPTFNQSRFKSFENGVNSQFYSLSKNPINEEKQYQSITQKEDVEREQFTKGWYEGAKKNGARNGYGTFYYKQGGKYTGYWHNNKMDGHGTLFYPDGRIAYQGQWKDDSLHGKGILLNQNPKPIADSYDFRSFDQCENEQYWTAYDGWFENDEKAGFGELRLSNNQKYVGEFRGDMVHGRGKFYKIDGAVVEGVWENNQLVQKL